MATRRCAECGAKLYDDEDECPKCGADVDERPRSNKEDRDDRWDPDEDRPKKKSRRDDDDEDDRLPKKKSDDFEVVEDDEDSARTPPPKKKSPSTKPKSADFEIEIEVEDEDAPPKPKAPPPPPKPKAPPLPPPVTPKAKAAEPPAPPKPKATPAPAVTPTPPAASAPVVETPAEPAKKRKSVFDDLSDPTPPDADVADNDGANEEEAPPPKKHTDETPAKARKEDNSNKKRSSLFDDEADSPKPTKAKRDERPAKPAEEDEELEERPKKRASGNKELVVPRWTGLFVWTLLFGLIGPALTTTGFYFIETSGVGREKRLDENNLFGNSYIVEYSSIKEDRLNTGMAMAIAGGTLLCFAYFLFLLWLWRSWRLIPKQYGGLSPIVAMLLLLTPLVNLVGIFIVLPGLSKAMRRMLEDIEPDRTPKTGVGVGMCACIFLFLPVLNVLSGLLFLAWFDAANFARNRIMALQDAAQASAA